MTPTNPATGPSTGPAPTPPREPSTHGLLRWTQPWYLAYGLVGVILLGIGPMLIPLTLAPKGAKAVGAVVAAFYVGALFSPVAGSWSDRHGAQRAVFLTCFPVMAASILLFAYADSTWQWALLAAVFGGAGAIAGSLGAAFVVEPNPRSEWNERISWFRLAYGAGQVVGLVVAAATATRLQLGWWLGAVLILPGVVVGRWGLPHLRATQASTVHAADLPTQGAFRAAPGIHGVLHHFHRPHWADLGPALRSRYGLFLLTWFITMIGVQTFFNVVPLIMTDAFGVTASASSLLFMVGAAIGSLVFPPLAWLADRIGPGRVLGLGMLITIGCFATMTTMTWLHPSVSVALGSLSLVVAAVAYSFEVVGATMLIARLTPFDEGSAMGMLNSAIAAGAIVGAIVPAWVADAFGYDSLPLMAALTLALALLIGSPLLLRGQRTAPSGTPS